METPCYGYRHGDIRNAMVIAMETACYDYCHSDSRAMVVIAMATAKAAMVITMMTASCYGYRHGDWVREDWGWMRRVVCTVWCISVDSILSLYKYWSKVIVSISNPYEQTAIIIKYNIL